MQYSIQDLRNLINSDEFKLFVEEQDKKPKYKILWRSASDNEPIWPFYSVEEAKKYIDGNFNFDNYYWFAYSDDKKEIQRKEWYELLIKPIN